MSDDTLLWPILLQVVLILINAFFAFSEIALISLNDNKVKRQSEDGDRKAKRLRKLIEHPERFLSTIQIGITLAGFLASAFAADNFAGRLSDWLIKDVGITGISAATLNTLLLIGITLILSYFMLVLGELVPKRLAMRNPEKHARRISGVISAVSIIFRPIVGLLSVSTNGVLRLFGVDPNEKNEEVTEEEIRLMVDIGEEKGAIESGEKELIENIFEFNNTIAREVMTHRTDAYAISIEDTDDTIIQIIQESGHSRFPVYDEDMDDIVGILLIRDYFLNAREKKPKKLKEILRSVYFVPETVRIDRLFRDMQTKNVHMAVVVDEYGGTSGIITMEDLLEEIVGNIYDEFDLFEQEITQLDENLWRASGSLEIETLEELFHLDIPDDVEYDTLGGLIYSQLSSIPDDGSRISLDVCGLHIQVEEITDRRIEWVLLSRIQHEEGENKEKAEQKDEEDA